MCGLSSICGNSGFNVLQSTIWFSVRFFSRVRNFLNAITEVVKDKIFFLPIRIRNLSILSRKGSLILEQLLLSIPNTLIQCLKKKKDFTTIRCNSQHQRDYILNGKEINSLLIVLIITIMFNNIQITDSKHLKCGIYVDNLWFVFNVEFWNNACNYA